MQANVADRDAVSEPSNQGASGPDCSRLSTLESPCTILGRCSHRHLLGPLLPFALPLRNQSLSVISFFPCIRAHQEWVDSGACMTGPAASKAGRWHSKAGSVSAADSCMRYRSCDPTLGGMGNQGEWWRRREYWKAWTMPIGWPARLIDHRWRRSVKGCDQRNHVPCSVAHGNVRRPSEK